jgi:hypothetical protein
MRWKGGTADFPVPTFVCPHLDLGFVHHLTSYIFQLSTYAIPLLSNKLLFKDNIFVRHITSKLPVDLVRCNCKYVTKARKTLHRSAGHDCPIERNQLSVFCGRFIVSSKYVRDTWPVPYSAQPTWLFNSKQDVHRNPRHPNYPYVTT